MLSHYYLIYNLILFVNCYSLQKIQQNNSIMLIILYVWVQQNMMIFQNYLIIDKY